MPLQTAAWSECRCDCHAPDGCVRANHIAQCCTRCTWCERNVAGDIGAHVEDEHPECVGREMPPSVAFPDMRWLLKELQVR
jgi:hypothetical protein